MKLAFTFKHMNGSDDVRTYAEQKSEKIKKYVDKPIDLHFFFSHDNNNYQTEITLLADHNRYVAEATAPNTMASVDMAMDKLNTQLRKHKEKAKNHHQKH